MEKFNFSTDNLLCWKFVAVVCRQSANSCPPQLLNATVAKSVGGTGYCVYVCVVGV